MTLVAEFSRNNFTMDTSMVLKHHGMRGRLIITGLEDNFGPYGRWPKGPQQAMEYLHGYFKETFEYLVGNSDEQITLSFEIAKQTAQFLKETN